MIKKTKMSLFEQNSKMSRVTDDHILQMKEDRQGTYNITSRYDQKCIMAFMQSKNYSSWVPIKLEFSRQIFEKYPNAKCNENPTSERPGCSMRAEGRTDRYDKANSHFSQILQTRLKIWVKQLGLFVII